MEITIAFQIMTLYIYIYKISWHRRPMKTVHLQAWLILNFLGLSEGFKCSVTG